MKQQKYTPFLNENHLSVLAHVGHSLFIYFKWNKPTFDPNQNPNIQIPFTWFISISHVWQAGLVQIAKQYLIKNNRTC